MYKFYHNKDLSNLVVNNINPYKLYDILSNIWSKKTCAPRMRDRWSLDDKTVGQCSITAFLVQDIFGGSVYGVPLGDGNYHCYNVVGDYIFDLTSEQFKYDLEYNQEFEQLRDNHFKKIEKYERYLYLKKRYNDYLNDILWVILPNLEMRYFKFGTGNKNIIIIPGLSILSVMDSKAAIINQYKKFMDKYTIYVFDRIEDIKEGYSIYDMADDMISVLDYLKLKDLYVFSTSQGGMISQVIAIKRPNLFKKMILGGSAPCVPLESKKMFSKWIDYAKNKSHEELMLEFASDVYSSEFFNKYKRAFIEMSKYITDYHINRYIICTNSLLDFDVRDKFRNIKCDILSITSKDDKVFDYKLFYEYKDMIKIEEYEHGSHAVYDEDPAYLDRIYTFFDK